MKNYFTSFLLIIFILGMVYIGVKFTDDLLLSPEIESNTCEQSELFYFKGIARAPEWYFAGFCSRNHGFEYCKDWLNCDNSQFPKSSPKFSIPDFKKRMPYNHFSELSVQEGF